ncbi:ABC-type multidrug transport system, ATPase component protein [Minicystis rosea]|nr:ABC-type multidrug transport system, ATPase component protein [Minicystis rosea]
MEARHDDGTIAVIEITDLHKYYGEHRAIGPLSCSIATGEIVGLLGLNGAGKTTTLRILACDLLPSSGTVTVDGIDVVERPHEVRSRIGYLPDSPPLYPEMTVRAYLTFAARLRGMSRTDAARRVPEVEELTELGDVADAPIASLSHGFKQRVGIAQAIVHRPRLLVLDEPITGLDPVQIVEMRELLRSLKGDHTILLSSHILSEISETCDRILVIKDGMIAASGTESELTSRLRSGGFRVVITALGEGEEATRIVREVSGVRRVEALAPAETGEGVTTFAVDADDDVRVAVCKALVEKGLGILQVGAGERELESVFLELATPAQRDKAAARKAKRATKQAAPAAKTKDDGGSHE